MTHWYVVTPEYDVVIPVTDEGQGPVETGCDVLEIEAETAKDAIALGVLYMLRGKRRDLWCHGRYHGWCEDQRSEKLSPFAGVRALPVGGRGTTATE